MAYEGRTGIVTISNDEAAIKSSYRTEPFSFRSLVLAKFGGFHFDSLPKFVAS